MTEKRILVKNIEVNYKVFGPTAQAGKGHVILILHGWGSNSDRWVKVAENLAEKNFMVVVPDLPGFGKSSTPETPWSFNNYVEFTKEFSDKLELGEFYLIGHSFGGSIAAKFASSYTQSVKKLFLVAAACVRERTAKKKALEKVSKIGRIFSFIPFYQFLRKAFYKFVIRKSDYIYTNGVMKGAYLKAVLEDLSNFLPSIKVKTIIVWGDKDAFTPIEQARIINGKIPGSKLIIIPGATHLLHKEVPDALAQKIIDNID